MRYVNLARNVENWGAYFLHKARIRRPDPLVFRCPNGVVAVVPRRLLSAFKEVFFDEMYLRRLPKGTPAGPAPTVLDIGANAGCFSLFLFSRFPAAKVIAVEPIPSNFAALERNRRENPGLDFTVVRKAASGKSGTVALWHDASDEFTTAASVLEGVGGKDRIEVESISLPDIFREYGLTAVDMLKMDCEGAEYDIFYNCPREILDRVASIAIEIHGGNSERERKEVLCAFLRDSGFRVVENEKSGMAWAFRPGTTQAPRE